MKKLFLGLLLLAVPSLAVDPVWIASNTATANTTKNLCPGQAYMLGTSSVTFGFRGVFHGLCINTGAAGTFTISDSSGTLVNPIAAINTATAQPCSIYDVATSSGLTYTNSATANVTILYQCY